MKRTATIVFLSVFLFIFILGFGLFSINEESYYTSLCQSKFSKEFDSTHYISSFTREWKWECIMLLRSCNLNGTQCFIIDHKNLGVISNEV